MAGVAEGTPRGKHAAWRQKSCGKRNSPVPPTTRGGYGAVRRVVLESDDEEEENVEKEEVIGESENKDDPIQSSEGVVRSDAV